MEREDARFTPKTGKYAFPGASHGDPSIRLHSYRTHAMKPNRTTMLGAALLCGALSLSPQAAESQSAAASYSQLFPTPQEGFTIRAEEQSLAGLLDEFSRVTGEHILYSVDTGTMLEGSKTQLQRDLEVAPERVYEVVQDILIQSKFVLTDVRRSEPRMLSVSSLESPERATVKQGARPVDADQLDEFARSPAMMIQTALHLPNLDVRTMGASMRQLVVDPNTMQIIPLPKDNTLILTGFGRNVHGLAQILRQVNEMAGTQQELQGAEELQEAMLEAADRLNGEQEDD